MEKLECLCSFAVEIQVSQALLLYSLSFTWNILQLCSFILMQQEIVSIHSSFLPHTPFFRWEQSRGKLIFPRLLFCCSLFRAFWAVLLTFLTLNSPGVFCRALVPGLHWTVCDVVRWGEVSVGGSDGYPCLRTRLFKFLSSDLEL